MVSLTASFNFKWPESVQDFFKINEPIGEVTTSIFSIDCFATDYLKANEFNKNQFFRIFYIKLLMIVTLPIVMAFVSFGAWRIIYSK